MTLVEDVLDPFPISDFLSSVMGKRFLHVRGSAGRFEHLLTWDTLNSLLQYHRFDSTRLRLIKDSKPISPDEFLRVGSSTQIDEQRLIQQLRAGAALVLNGINEVSETISRLAEGFERLLSERVTVNAYVGWQASKGFDCHWDDHDVLVLQVSGRKHWKVHSTSRPHPLFRDIERDDNPPAEVVWQGLLNDGDLLYIPRGWWHVATAVDVPTIHLTFGVQPRTGIDLLGWMQDELRAVDIFRQDLPRFSSFADQDAHMAALERAMHTFWHSGVILQRYLSSHDAMAGSKRRINLSEVNIGDSAFALGVTVEFCPPRRINLTIAGDEVSFDSLGKSWFFDKVTADILAMLDARRVCSVDELSSAAPQIPLPTLQAFLRELLDEGLIAIRR